MKIGVWVNEPLSKNSGGSFTYFNTLITSIDNFSFDPAIEIIFLSRHNLSGFNKPFINVKPFQRELSYFVKAFRKILKLLSNNTFKKWINSLDQKEKKLKDNSVAASLKKQGVKIIFYPLPASHIIEGISYILNNWDLGHYATYAFPEITDNDGFNRRNDWYLKVVPSALMVFCESEAGKNEIITYLNLNPDKIKVLPIFGSDVFMNMQVTDKEQERLLEFMELKQKKFFFYPAQFWAHKNHYTLINAFQRFLLLYPDHKLFFCGSDKGNLLYIKNYVNTLDLDGSVIFGGFIEDIALYTLYKNARALIMPTFFGPSNIPPIEAMFLQCPALCSGIEGHKEIMNNAALYFDPLDDSSILESMKLIMNDSTREQILRNQKEQSKLTPHTIEKALIKLEAHFLEAINIRSCWE